MENNSTDPHDPDQATSHGKSLNILRDDTKIKNVKKNYEVENAKDCNDDEEDEEEGEEEEEDLTEALLVQMGYWKPEPKKPPPMASPNANIKLVSAMKGSREKEGKEGTERRVSWAPDVYDPVPRSPEHFATSRTIVKMKIESKKEKGGKNKQKAGEKAASKGGGGGGKGGKGKDKKQAKRYGGSASRCFDSLDEDDTLVGYN